MRGIFLRWACVSAALLLLLGPATGAVAAAGRPFIAPVDAEVTRRFEAPSHKFGPGHRGIDYGVPSGTTVRASGEGTVTFAGPVAADGLFITIEHAGGISTTYSYLSRVDVSQGDRVSQGQAIALSGEGHPGGSAALHFGAKRNGEYIDPELLLKQFDDITDLLQLAPAGAKRSSDGLSAFGGKPADFGVKNISADLRGSSTHARIPPNRAVEPLELSHGQIREPELNRDAPTASPQAPGMWQPLGFKPSASNSSAWPSSLTRAQLVENSADVPAVHPRYFDADSSAIDATPKSKSGIGFKEQLARWADNIGDFNLEFADEPVLALFAPPVGGAFKEAACWLRGGGEAPVFYPETELQRGFNYGRPDNTEAHKSAPNDHVVIAVAGIRTQSKSIDEMSALYQDSWWKDLGYNESDVYFFSYKGRPKNNAKSPRAGSFEFHEPYSRQDTYQPIEESALKLSQQIQAIQKAHPGRKIDIVAHSQGGAVSQYYLANLYRPDRAPLRSQKTSPHVANFVSISSPHLGTPGATGYATLTDSWHGRETYLGIEKTVERLGLPKGSADSSIQLNPDSDFIKDAVRDWNAKKVNATTITTPLDVAVIPKYTRLEGAQHYTVWIDPFDAKPLGHHGTVVGMPETKAIVYNALRGTPSRCTGFMNAISDEITGEAIGHTESGLLKAIDLFMNFPWH
jgi:hypothetical protein